MGHTLARRGLLAPWQSVLVSSQRQGRGQLRRNWVSPAGNIYAALRLPMQEPFASSAASTVTGAMLAAALGKLGFEVRLKWPNDLLARGLKLAGILVETARDDAGQTFAVCGVGLNVGRAPRGLGAICLAALGDAPSFSPLAERLRSGVVSRVDAWAAASGERPLDGIRSDYLARLAWLGEKVRVLAAEGGSELACGTLETVDPWGRAVVAGVPYASELVSLRPTG